MPFNIKSFPIMFINSFRISRYKKVAFFIAEEFKCVRNISLHSPKNFRNTIKLSGFSFLSTFPSFFALKAMHCLPQHRIDFMDRMHLKI